MHLVPPSKGKREGDLKPRLDGRQEWVRIKMASREKIWKDKNTDTPAKEEEEKGRFHAGQ